MFDLFHLFYQTFRPIGLCNSVISHKQYCDISYLPNLSGSVHCTVGENIVLVFRFVIELSDKIIVILQGGGIMGHMHTRVDWFSKKYKRGTCLSTPITKFHFLMLLFNLAQGIIKCWMLLRISQQIKLHFLTQHQWRMFS